MSKQRFNEFIDEIEERFLSHEWWFLLFLDQQGAKMAQIIARLTNSDKKLYIYKDEHKEIGFCLINKIAMLGEEIEYVVNEACDKHFGKGTLKLIDDALDLSKLDSIPIIPLVPITEMPNATQVVAFVAQEIYGRLERKQKEKKSKKSKK